MRVEPSMMGGGSSGGIVSLQHVWVGGMAQEGRVIWLVSSTWVQTTETAIEAT